MKEIFNKIILIIFIMLFSVIYLSAEPPKLGKSNKVVSSLLPDRIIAGFLDIRTPGSTTRVSMQQVKADGYNVMIVAYGEIYGTNIGFYTSDENTDISTQTTVDKIREAKKAGMKVLLAVGGVPNTFHPGVKQGDPDPKRLGNDMSSDQINALAGNIVTFLKRNDIDGITYSVRQYTSPGFLAELSNRIKKIDPKIVITAEPEVNNYQLVTIGRSTDFDKAIQSGSIDYLFIQEYNTFPEYDPQFISNSYAKIVENSKIPLNTRILIGEPTNAVSGGTNTIYHPEANATKSLTTEEAIGLMLPELEKLKFKPRFAGIVGWSLNTDYAADLYGDAEHKSGSFARGLRACIYNKKCATIVSKIDGPIIAGILPLWGKSSSYNISGQQINTKAINISMPKDQEYCDKNPNVCKYNVIIAAYLTYNSNKGFELSFNDENGSSEKIYTPEQIKAFISYMRSKGKHVLVSVGGKFSYINWHTVDLNTLIKIIQDYEFDGVNFNLTNSDIPSDEKVSHIAADKIKNLMYKLKQQNPNIWLTFSPSWSYIVAPLAKNNIDNIYANDNYLKLLKSVGIDNIDYIWLNTYDEKAVDGISSFYKNKQGQYLKISPIDGYAKFLASLAWALTTQEGYTANMPKYSVGEPFIIPADKLVFIIPATEGAAHSGMVYVLLPKDIQKSVALMKANKASFAGFAIWSVDFDATNIELGQLGDKYSHQAWSTTDAISGVSLPPITSQVSNIQDNKEKAVFVEKSSESGIDTGIIAYPDKIGTYSSNTVVSYQGKNYKCISPLEVRLCNDKGYIPNGLHGYLAWSEVNQEINIQKPKRIVDTSDETLRYPEGIGNYKSGQIVAAGDRKFECQSDKQALCNSISYEPTGRKGYSAWTDVTNDLVAESDNNKPQIKPSGADYVYPNDINNYTGGTVVAVGQDLYRCKVGPESSLCSMEAYDPNGKYGKDAWSKIDKKSL